MNPNIRLINKPIPNESFAINKLNHTQQIFTYNKEKSFDVFGEFRIDQRRQNQEDRYWQSQHYGNVEGKNSQVNQINNFNQYNQNNQYCQSHQINQYNPVNQNNKVLQKSSTIQRSLSSNIDNHQFFIQSHKVIQTHADESYDVRNKQRNNKQHSNKQNKQNKCTNCQLIQKQKSMLYNLMRQQIQITTKKYQQKTHQIIKQQCRQICDLRKLLFNNNKLLSNYQQSSLLINNNSKSPTKLSLTKSNRSISPVGRKSKIQVIQRQKSPNNYGNMKYSQMDANNIMGFNIQQRLTQVQNQIRHLRQNNINVQLRRKVQFFQTSFANFFALKINQSKQATNQFTKRINKALQYIEIKLKQPITTTPKITPITSIHSSQKLVSSPNYSLIIKKLTTQIQDIKSHIYSLENKQFKYDNYNLGNLQQCIVNLREKVLEMEVQRNQMLEKSQISRNLMSRRQIQPKNQYIVHNNHSYQQNELKYHQNISKYQQNTSKYHQNASKHSTKNTLYCSNNLQEIHSRKPSYQQIENKSMHSYHHSEIPQNNPYMQNSGYSQNSSVVEEAFSQSSNQSQEQYSQSSIHYYPANQTKPTSYPNHNINRFLKVIQSQQQRPLQIQVDQTGYVKSSRNGMYIVDQNMDGFQFDRHELDYLRNRGVVIY